MSKKQTVFVKIPFSLTVNEEDLSELSAKIGEKALKECYERMIRECTDELVTFTRKQALNVPIKEKMHHKIVGEFPDVTNESKQGVARGKILEILQKNSGRKYSIATLCQMIDIDAKTISNGLYFLERKGTIAKFRSNEGLVLWGLSIEQQELSDIFPRGTKAEVFGS